MEIKREKYRRDKDFQILGFTFNRKDDYKDHIKETSNKREDSRE